LYYPLTVSAPERPNGFTFRADVIQLGPLTVGELSFGSTVSLISDDLDAYHLTLPTAGTVRTRHAGHEVLAGANRAVVFGPGGVVDTLHEAGSAELDIKIERAALEDELATLLGRRVRGPIRLPPSASMTDGPLRSWGRIVRMLQDEIDRPGTLVRQPLIAEHVRSMIMTGLLLSLPHEWSEELAAPGRAGPPRTIRRAVDAMHDEPDRAYAVGDLARIAGISVRSLQEGFQRYVGCAPMVYLQRIRLNRAHELLRDADPARVTVSAVAHSCGFSHLGRFAAAYRQRFGASPSETLRNC
jgi:AraC-like DNA-binding protein